MTRAQRTVSRILQWACYAGVALMLIFLFVPVLVTVLLSFSNEAFLQFPPHAYGLRQYIAFFSSPHWTGSVVKSIELGLPTALLATGIGLPAVLAFNRTKLPFREGLELAGLSPLLLPMVAYAMAMYAMYAQFHLIGSAVGLVLADTAIAFPYVIVIVGAAIKRVPPELELVAMTLGASQTRAFVGVTFRMLLPAIGAAFIFAFVIAFDEATFVNFLGGPNLITLPKAIFDSLRLGIDPLITSIATILMTLTGVAMTTAMLLRR